MERNKPCAGELYRHFKGNLYQIIGRASDAGSLEEVVVYQALYGDYRWYVRPLCEFMSPVDAKKYPEYEGKWRFERLEQLQQAEEPEEISVSENVSMHEIIPQDKEAAEKSQIRSELIQFLDAESAEEKLQVLRKIRRKVDEELLTNMELSLDLMPDDRESMERRLELIELNLEKRVKYEGGRLR